MVQRKVPSKLSISTDHLKSENRVGKLKPPSPRSQDGKNKGSEMKKKMKKLKSMKDFDIESCLKSPNFTKQVPQPGKPPTLVDNPKQAPNYMKSTSSFEARKEQSQVTSQTSANTKSAIKSSRNSKASSNSSHKQATTLTRTSSLKKVRSLTKTPSFKLTRAATKKCSQVVLAEDLKSQRATCSSTLKDSKFPNYLELSKGATESEGTSFMKVCPYTYCSLNGHHHAPLPPLKSFLSTKRLMLKTQKSIKLGCISPRKTKPSSYVENEISEEMEADDDEATIQEQSSQEDQKDFYFEIYVHNRGDDSEIEFACKGIGDEIDSGNDLEACDEVILMQTDPKLCTQEEQIVEEAEEVYSSNSDQEEEASEILSNKSDMELSESGSETDDMEWDEAAEDETGYDSENISLYSESDPVFHKEYDLSITSFDEIQVEKGEEEVFVQTGDDDPESTCDKKGETSIEPIEDEETSAALENQGPYSGESQQEEIHEDYESEENNNTQVCELEVCEELFVGEIFYGAKDSEKDQDECDIDTSTVDEFENLFDHSNDMVTDGKTEIQSDELLKNNNIDEHKIGSDEDTNQALDFESSDSIGSEDQAAGSEVDIVYLIDNDNKVVENDETKKQGKSAYARDGSKSGQDQQNNTFDLRIIKREKSEEELDTDKDFNPREPNYLPIKPDPESEKVDLKHQDLDDKKNAEEWMLDYALQQTVTKLAPARKKKVALLVEAFEKVMPPKYESLRRHSSPAFAPAIPIQACR